MRNLFPEVMRRHNSFFGFDTSLWDMMKEDFFKPVSLATFAADVEETKEAYVIYADLPGFSKENIELDYHDNILTIKATRNEELEEKKDDGTYIRKERSFGSYVRHFIVEGVNENEIKASFANGVLTVTLPKQAETKRRIIDIE
ncbi:MAG: Hsp20/alpha crystallin family protein [Ectobacillus sp.]